VTTDKNKLNRYEVRKLREDRREFGPALTWTGFYIARVILWFRGEFLSDRARNAYHAALILAWGAVSVYALFHIHDFKQYVDAYSQRFADWCFPKHQPLGGN
jgi:hypothetical protein